MLRTLCRVSHVRHPYLHSRRVAPVQPLPSPSSPSLSQSVRHLAERRSRTPRPSSTPEAEAGFWTLLKGLQIASEDEIQNFARMFPEETKGVDMNWSDVFSAPNFHAALTALEEKGIVAQEVAEHQASSSELPVWLLLYLIRFKVHNPEEAHSAAKLAISEVASTPPIWQRRVLVSAVRVLAEYEIFTPVQRLVEEFTFLSSPPSGNDFNELVRAIAEFPGSSPSRQLMVKVLSTMHARQHNLTLETYDALLADRFLTLELTKALVEQMSYDGYVPTADQLESYIRIFARNGAIHESATYLDALRAMRLGSKQIAPYSSNPRKDAVDPMAEARMPANTLHLSALKFNPTSAFEYLNNMLTLEQHNLRGRTTPMLPPSGPHSKEALETADLKDWTTFLVAAERDVKNIDSERLLKLFRAVRTPTVVTHQVLIRGLIRRREHGKAVEHFRALRDRNEDTTSIDAWLLASGILALGRIGGLYEAFLTMELFANPVQKGLAPRIDPHGKVSPSAVDTTVVNAFMAAAHRAHRPDLVFVMWDHQYRLYKTLRDVKTLNTMLDGARKAWSFQDTIRGAFAHLQSHLAALSPFRTTTSKPLTRDDVVREIIKLLEGDNIRVTGLWHGAPAWKQAKEIFLGVLQNWPELQGVRCPLGVSVENEMQQRHNRMAPEAKSEQPTDSSSISSPSPPGSKPIPPLGPFPNIIPTDGSFCAYIRLLGTAHLSVEIPLALAWMRALHIRPTEKTLSIAILLWADHSIGGLTGESDRWTDVAAHRRRLQHLMRWMRDWVGADQVPSKENIDHWMRVLDWTRYGRHWDMR